MPDLNRREAIIDVLLRAGVEPVTAAECADKLLALSKAEWTYLKNVRDSAAVKFAVSEPHASLASVARDEG